MTRPSALLARPLLAASIPLVLALHVGALTIAVRVGAARPSPEPAARPRVPPVSVRFVAWTPPAPTEAPVRPASTRRPPGDRTVADRGSVPPVSPTAGRPRLRATATASTDPAGPPAPAPEPQTPAAAAAAADDDVPATATASAGDETRFYGFEEVEVPAAPASDWNLDAVALDTSGIERLVVDLYVDATGEVIECRVVEPVALADDVRTRLESRLSDTVLKPALREGHPVPSVRRIEMTVS